MMADLIGNKNEVEAMLASGGSGIYKEGKLLDIVDLKDKDGRNTSTCEAQAKAVYNNIEEWSILPAIRGFVFDTTASNTGWQSGLSSTWLVAITSWNFSPRTPFMLSLVMTPLLIS